MDLGLEGLLTGGIQEKKDTGKEGNRKGGFSTGGMPNRRDAGQEGYRTGEMEESRDTEKQGCRKGGMQ